MLGGNSPPISQHALFLLVSCRMSQKFTRLSVTSKGDFAAKYRLSNEKSPAIICKFVDCPVKAFITVDMCSLIIHHDDVISIIIVSGEKCVDRGLYFVVAKCVLKGQFYREKNDPTVRNNTLL